MKAFKNIKKIEIKDLSFKYDGIPVLKDLNVEFESGKLIVIMGPNGAGKTTLFKIIDLLLTPQKGKILADGRDIFEFSKKERMEWRKNMGFVFQEPFLLNSSVWKNTKSSSPRVSLMVTFSPRLRPFMETHSPPVWL